MHTLMLLLLSASPPTLGWTADEHFFVAPSVADFRQADFELSPPREAVDCLASLTQVLDGESEPRLFVIKLDGKQCGDAPLGDYKPAAELAALLKAHPLAKPPTKSATGARVDVVLKNATGSWTGDTFTWKGTPDSDKPVVVDLRAIA